MSHRCKVELYEELHDERYLNQLWNIIKEYDTSFTPHLSKRDSVINYDLLVDEDKNDGDAPYKFYNEIKDMSFILYTVDGSIKAFLAYKRGYVLDALSHMELEPDKSIYVAFSLVLKEYRNDGVFYMMNSLLEGFYRKKYDVIQRRVKSTNLPMLNSLTTKNSYTLGKRVKNERGEGVDTYSLYKYL